MIYVILTIFFNILTFASQDSIYYKNFIRHSDGTLCKHIPPITSFVIFLNNDDSLILTENAPRWDTSAEPNIPGNGTFGVELANFKNVKAGDKVYVKFFCKAYSEFGNLVDSITNIPWARFPQTLYLNKTTFPEPPDEITLLSDENGRRILKWNQIPSCSYTIYRKELNDTIQDGRSRNLYHLIAQNLTMTEFIDSTTSKELKYGYIIFSKDQNGILSPHSTEVSDPVGGVIQNLSAYPRKTTVTLFWEALHKSNPKIAGYNIYRRSQNERAWNIAGYTGLDTFFIDSRLTPGTIYYYKISARDNLMNEIAQSNEIEVNTSYSGENLYSYATLRVALVIYKNTNRGQISDSEVEKIKLMIEEARRFYWRNSYMKLNVLPYYIIIDNYTEFPNPDDAWGSTLKTGNDLKNLGVASTQYDIICRITTAVSGYWSWGVVDLGLPGPPRKIGFSHIQWPPATDVIYPGKNPNLNYNLTWVFVHEVQHAIDAVYNENNHPEMAHGDVPWEFTIPCGEHYDFQAKIFRTFNSYEDIKTPWGILCETSDNDNDGFPDYDPLVPFDESSVGTSIYEKDTDHDGLDDKSEICNGTFDGSNPLNPDTDDDGYQDGQDPYPRYRLKLYIPFAKQKPIIDGFIENTWELICDSVAFTQIGYSPKLFMCYDNDSLYLALQLNNVGIPEFFFDFQNDGWWWGSGNTTMKINFSTGGFQYVNSWDASPEVRSYSISLGGPGGMWDNDPKYQAKFNRKVFDPTSINLKMNINFPKISIEMAIPKNDYAGLKLQPGDTIGFNIRFTKVNNDPAQWASMFDLYSFAYVILEKPTYVKNLIQEISDFELQEPYPNPFNSQTSIQVNIPEKSYVEISIYDILAQKVKVIYSGTLNRGIYTFYWDGKNEKLQDLSSGVYLCILKATRDKRTEILTRKIILMK